MRWSHKGSRKAYRTCPFCKKSLRWAKQAKRHLRGHKITTWTTRDGGRIYLARGDAPTRLVLSKDERERMDRAGWGDAEAYSMHIHAVISAGVFETKAAGASAWMLAR